MTPSVALVAELLVNSDGLTEEQAAELVRDLVEADIEPGCAAGVSDRLAERFFAGAGTTVGIDR